MNEVVENNKLPVSIDEALEPLSVKERMVVQHFCGSGKATWMALEKSYPGEFSKFFVRECLTDIKVIRAIRIFAGYNASGVLHNDEIKQFWSKVVMDDEQSMKDRLKASELLGKTHKMFVESVEIGASEDFAKQLSEARERLKEITVDVVSERVDNE